MKSSRSPHELQVKQTESQPVHIKVRRLSAAAMAATGVMIPFAKAETANAQPLNGGMQYVEKTDRHLSDADRKYEHKFIARLNTRVSQNLRVSSYTFYFKQGKNGLRDFSRAYTMTLPNGEEANDFVMLRNPDHSPMTDIAQLPAQD
jgi:hypothetical protein